MGARESTARDAQDEQTSQPDYYTLLEVDENATQDEIRVILSAFLVANLLMDALSLAIIQKACSASPSGQEP